MKIDWFKVFMWAVGIACALAAVATYGQWRECKEKGGQFFCAHGSTCICLAPGIVIP